MIRTLSAPRVRRRLFRVVAAACLAVTIVTGFAVGQEIAPDALTEARQLRNAGDLDRAVTVLRRRLERVPGDVDARWMLAETLYWSGEIDLARAEYLRALEDRSGDPGLRIDVARFLLETGRAREARRTLAPLDERAPPAWEPEIHRLRRAILAVSAPWARIAPRTRDDSQSLTLQGIEVEAGYWPVDGLSMAIRATPQRLEGELETSGEEPDLAGLEAVASVAYRPAGSPVSIEGEGGVFMRDRPESTDGVGEATVALHLPRAVALLAGASRAAYLWTVSSLDREVLVDGIEGVLDRSGARGWAFQAGVRRETFVLGENAAGSPGRGTSVRDDNAVTSAWAWALAPLWVRDRGSFRAGYAFQWQDSEETRFVPDGFYDPYYTPEEIRVHQAVVAIALRPVPTVTIRADGGVGIVAEESAPQVVPSTAPGRPGTVTFFERDFTPWRARVSVAAALGATGRLRAEIERNEDAFFRSTRGEISLTWWLVR